jgi:hypothetical protein
MSIPWNREKLWNGKIQRSAYPSPIEKPPMILPPTNWLTGIVLRAPDIQKEMNVSYAAYSKKYWEGVKKRQQEYRR